MRAEIGVGVVGLGWMGQVHSRGYRRLLDHYPDCPLEPRLVMAADAVEARARESAGRLGYEGWSTDWREVVEHPEVEAVSITAPNYLHREIAVAAARAGKHVWLEKPCGRVPAETYEIERAIEEAGVRSMIGLMYRHAPAVEYAREVIASAGRRDSRRGAPLHGGRELRTNGLALAEEDGAPYAGGRRGMSARPGSVEGYGQMQEGGTGLATGERAKDDPVARRAESGRIAVGVVGSGGMGRMHAENLRWKVPGARLTAVADPDFTRAEELAGRCGPATVFEDPVDLIRDPGIEAVVVASPDPTHAPLVLECLRNAKPVLCEKPLADSSSAALQVVEAEVGLGKRLVQVGFMRRYDPQHVAVKEAVESGAIGEPVLFKGWHRNVGFGEGRGSESVVVSATIHDLDSTRWFLGQEIAEVYARGANTDPELDNDFWDLQLIQLLTTGGRMGTIETYVSSRYGYEVGVEVVGERGIVQTSPPTGAVVRREGAASQRIEQDWLDRFRAAYEVEARLWVESLLDGTPGGPDAWDGYASLVAADACVASLCSGSPERVARLDRPAFYGGREQGADR